MAFFYMESIYIVQEPVVGFAIPGRCTKLSLYQPFFTNHSIRHTLTLHVFVLVIMTGPSRDRLGNHVVRSSPLPFSVVPVGINRIVIRRVQNGRNAGTNRSWPRKFFLPEMMVLNPTSTLSRQ
jgi:hypothetical protein